MCDVPPLLPRYEEYDVDVAIVGGAKCVDVDGLFGFVATTDAVAVDGGGNVTGLVWYGYAAAADAVFGAG